MALAPGTRFGSYDVVEQIGSGGMGEVYRATDTSLKRDVALKVLPDNCHLDSQASMWLEREAKLLAALNHPNIATLHGLETADEAQALVMELVEGEGLDARIARSPDGLPVSEAIEISEQIAAALDTAHESGIVHRDLKPANIKIRPDGTVKVLDFGIAKAFATDGGSNKVGTVTKMPGAIVGTPSYMSPEQATGAEVDRRTDIWAFGCVLYEMLTGQCVFDGDTSSRILARVLERDPNWEALPDDLPSRVRTLLRQCLEKNVRRRRRDAGDLRLELELAGSEPDEEPSSKRGGIGLTVAWLAASTGLVALAATALYVYDTEEPLPQRVLDVVTPVSRQPHEFAVSPDGRYITYVAAVSADTIRHALYLRDLQTGEAELIPGTEGARNPCWSPDSRSIAFVAAEYLQRVDVNGGYPQRLAPALNGIGCSWGENGRILFTPSAVTELYSVPEVGGVHRPITQIDLDREPDDPAYETNHIFPSFLPGTERFIYYVTGGRDVRGIHLGSLDGRPSKRLIASDSAGAVVAPSWIVYGQSGRLLAQRLDLDLAELTGEPVVLSESIVIPAFRLPFSASRDGQLFAFRNMPFPGGILTHFDRNGEVLLVGPSVNGPNVSPDDRSIAYDNRGAGGNRDVYVARVEGDADNATVSVERITGDATVEGYPVFSPDGRELIYEKQRPDDKFFELWRVDLNRPDEARPFYSEGEDLKNLIPLDWSVNGWMVARRSDADFLSSDLIAVSTVDDNPTPIEIADTIYEERLAQVSPNGNWVAYDSDQPGRFGVFVQPFPDSDSGSRYQITGDGFAPRWSADGTEIYFETLDGQLMATSVTDLGSEMTSGAPVELFRAWIGGPSFNHQYDVTSDGRFLINVLDVDENPAPIKVIQNSTVFAGR